MPWLKFTENFNWKPPKRKNVIIAFHKGSTVFVTRHCATRALAAGKAVPTTRPTSARQEPA